MQPDIEIYHADLCGACHEAMDYFTGRGIPFRDYKVAWDPAADRWVDDANSRRMLAQAGPVDIVPQIFVNGRHFDGWRSLQPLIESGEIDRLLAAPRGAPA